MPKSSCEFTYHNQMGSKYCRRGTKAHFGIICYFKNKIKDEEVFDLHIIGMATDGL